MSSENNIAIKVENLTKAYKLYNNPVDRMKESLHPLRKKYHHDFYALNDVSFEVKKGETVGIIGKNGSGKSTLLKTVAGVLTPTAGNIQVNGKVSALLELGAGFNPEFTGVENVYFNGSIMGYTRAEMDAKLDEILSFADIGEFVYQPVKIYSSGMFVRLAFALAVNVDPDILIVDEALSVGDMTFQKKCMEKIDLFRESGKTILFCGHDMHAVSSLCSRALWVKDGIIEEIGEANNVISSYVSWMTATPANIQKDQKIISSESNNPNYYVRNSEVVEIISVKSYNVDNKETDVFFNGDDIIFEVTYNAFNEIKDPNYSIIIFRNDKVPACIAKRSYDKTSIPEGIIKGHATLRVKLKNLSLNAGIYTFGISVWDKFNKICFANNITHEFEVRSLKIVYGPTEEKAVYFPEAEWM